VAGSNHNASLAQISRKGKWRTAYPLLESLGVIGLQCRKASDKISNMHETFEHTADLGLRVRAPDLDALFAEAAEALFAAIADDLSTVQPIQAHNVQLNGQEREYLLFDWLNELLFRFDTQHLVFSRFEVRITGSDLHGTAWGEPLDPSRHLLSHEVKAITYHGLRVEREGDGWLAEVIVDI
jgi:SHS2 domain-containing protein